MTGWGEVLAGALTGVVGGGGGAGLLLVRVNRRRANADTELVLQRAAAQAVKTVQEAADETREDLKEAREEIRRLKDELAQSRSELLQARREMEALRSQQAVERQQLLEQIAAERAAHEAAMAAVRRELSDSQLRRLVDGGIGTVLGAEDFGG